MLHYPAAPPSDPVDSDHDAPDAAFLPRYLARIGYREPVAPTMEVLAALQAAHIAAIPFEAIDALTGAGVDIGADAVDAKLIGGRRGGYCFEQNALFLRVLGAIGFDAEGLIGRVRWMLPDDAPPTARTHMVVRVRLGGRPWLVDVGFGATVPPAPLAMDSEEPQPTRHETYRIVRHGEVWQVAALIEGAWRTLYRIEDTPPPAIDYEIGNWYTSAHPDSHFRHQLIAARTTAEARYGLRDNRLTTRLADGRIDRRYLTADEIERTLSEIFLLPVQRHWRAAIERAATAEIAGYLDSPSPSRSFGSERRERDSMADKKVVLLSGGNPQIAKGYGDAPVQAYIAAMPGWKSGVWARLDTLVEKTVPGAAQAVKWNSPLYGPPGQGDAPTHWFLSVHCFDKYIKIAFFRGQSLDPVPPVASKSGDTRYFHIREGDTVDEAAFADWVRQAAALPGEKM